MQGTTNLADVQLDACKLYGSGQLGFALKRRMVRPCGGGQIDGQSAHYSVEWEKGASEERAAGKLLECGNLHPSPYTLRPEP